MILHTFSLWWAVFWVANKDAHWKVFNAKCNDVLTKFAVGAIFMAIEDISNAFHRQILSLAFSDIHVLCVFCKASAKRSQHIATLLGVWRPCLVRHNRCVYHFFVRSSNIGSFIYSGTPIFNSYSPKWRWLERFSIECRKTKTRVITLANHKGHR